MLNKNLIKTTIVSLLITSAYVSAHALGASFTMDGMAQPTNMIVADPTAQVMTDAIMPDIARQQNVTAAVQSISNKTTLRIEGAASEAQTFNLVKAIACREPVRDNQNLLRAQCSAPIYFPLNTDQELAPGNYILGFSNSIYPGFVTINAGDRKVIQLQQIPLRTMGGDREVRVYRNFASLAEQKKIYFSVYYLSEHLFKLTQYNFGDLYLTQDRSKNVLTTFDQRSCKRLDPNSRWSDFAKRLCNTYLSAQSMMDLSDFFMFESNDKFQGQYQEAFIWSPGDIFSVRYAKHLVALPMDLTNPAVASAAGQSVQVFAGSYVVSITDKKGKIRNTIIDANSSEQTYTAEQLKKNMQPPDMVAAQAPTVDDNAVAGAASADPTAPDASAVEASDNQADGITAGPANDNAELSAYTSKCRRARLWKTESRSYCSADSQDGCDRSVAKLCEPMDIIDYRFRVR